MIKTCCDAMDRQINHSCPQHKNECPDYVAAIGKRSDQLFLVAQNATWAAYYCPWCGKKWSDKQ